MICIRSRRAWLSILVLLAGCGAPRPDLLSTAISPDGRHKASLYKERDPAGVLGEDVYIAYVEPTQGSNHDRLEVFSGANAHRTSLQWNSPSTLVVEFCNGRSVRSTSRYVSKDSSADDWITIQDVRAANVRIGDRVFCPTAPAG